MFGTRNGNLNFVTFLSPNLRGDVGDPDCFLFETKFHLYLGIGLTEEKFEFLNLQVGFISQYLLLFDSQLEPTVVVTSLLFCLL